VSDEPDSQPFGPPPGDRRRMPREGKDRRNLATRVPGVWTAAERERFIAEIREGRRDAQAVTIQAGVQVNDPSSGTET